MNPAPAAQPVIAVDFSKRRRLHALGGGLYLIPGREGFYARPVCKGRQRERKLKSLTERAARAELGKLLHAIARFEAGLDKDPFAEAGQSLDSLCQLYLDLGCPLRRGQARTGAALQREQGIVAWVRRWPGARRPAAYFTMEDCARYRKWRVSVRTRQASTGDRAADLELATLSNIFRCAARRTSLTGISVNPIAHDRPRFRDTRLVAHCRDKMPRSGDELHALAHYHFDGGRRLEVFGWLILLTAITGHRIGAMMKLRVDAVCKEPGWATKDRIYLWRSESHKATAGHVDLTADEQQCLTAFQAWHQRRFPKSPWYFPGRNPSKPLDAGALTHRLPDVARALGQGHRTAHGLRAFRVNVLRSRGLSDDHVALLVGHKSPAMIRDVYGEGLDYKLEFMPKEIAPAWEIFGRNPVPAQTMLV